MANLMTTDLPSEDEEDDDYDAVADKTCEAGDRVDHEDELLGDQEADLPEDPYERLVAEESHPRKRRQKEMVAELWTQLSSKHGGGEKRRKVLDGPGFEGLAMLCNRTSRAVATVADADSASWMRQLGLTAPAAKAPRPVSAPKVPDAKLGRAGGAKPASAAVAAILATQTTRTLAASLPDTQVSKTSEEERAARAAALREAAAAALAGAEAAASLATARAFGKVTVTEKRKFAGKEIEVERKVSAAERDKMEAKKVGTSAGLDAVLGSMKAKKSTVADKTQADWDRFKDKNRLEEELDEYKKSGSNFMARQNFLKDAELREYEKERDAKLAADSRTRGR